jgi:hypothetical protein
MGHRLIPPRPSPFLALFIFLRRARPRDLRALVRSFARAAGKCFSTHSPPQQTFNGAGRRAPGRRARTGRRARGLGCGSACARGRRQGRSGQLRSRRRCPWRRSCWMRKVRSSPKSPNRPGSGASAVSFQPLQNQTMKRPAANSPRLGGRLLPAALALLGGIRPDQAFLDCALELAALSCSPPGLVRPTEYSQHASTAAFQTRKRSTLPAEFRGDEGHARPAPPLR